MTLAVEEYIVLRRTIATRGTIRILLAPVALLGWSAAVLTLLFLPAIPAAALLPLLVLTAGFEAIHALHVGVERIGRYLQVFYEEPSRGEDVAPRWETTAMAAGPALPGGGVDPLFTVLFAAAALVNLLTAFPSGTTPPEGILMSAAHIVFLVRLVRARRAAARQRQRDLDRFRGERDAGASTGPTQQTR